MSDDRTELHQVGHDMAFMVRVAVVGVLLAAVVLVAFDNRRDVRVGYVVGDAQAPIWIVLVAAGIAGIVIGAVARHRPGRR